MSGNVIAVTVPAGVMPGGQFMVRAPNGQSMVAQVPYGMMAGQLMYVRIPAPPPMPVVMVQEQQVQPDSKPPEDVKVVEPKAWDPSGLKMAPNPEDLMPICAVCCVICSCYLNSPDCIGYYTKGVCACAEVEWLCCKPGKAENSVCICAKAEIEFIKPSTCLKMNCQECCLDSRCAFPCDEEVPCIIALLGFQCVKDYKCSCAFGESLVKKEESTV